MQGAALRLSGYSQSTQGAARMASSRMSHQHTPDPDPPACARCNTKMTQITSIAPTIKDPGLIAYECPRCGHLTSVIDPAGQ
jgi:hypothetical protein